MRVGYLKDFLSSFEDDVEVYITTVPTDFFSPLTNSKIKIMPANIEEKYGLNREKIVLIAFKEDEWGKP